MGCYAYAECPIALDPQELALFAAAANPDKEMDFSKENWWEWACWDEKMRHGWFSQATLGLRFGPDGERYCGNIWIHHLRSDGSPIMMLSVKVDTGPNLPKEEAIRRLSAIVRETGGLVRYEDNQPVLVVSEPRLPFSSPMRFVRQDDWSVRLHEACQRIRAEVARAVSPETVDSVKGGM